MNQRANRTFVCSVLYLDLVAYSTQSVTTQLKLKQALNGHLREVLGELAAVDRIVLDVAGGVVLSFLGRPADALLVALDLRQKMAAECTSEPAAAVRIGINLGPVRVVDEPGGQFNLLGDGISVAERIMNFAEPGTILVSRSYYEVLCRQLPDFEPVFRFEGTRTDRQVREHAVFAVDVAAAALLRAKLPSGWRARPPSPPPAPTLAAAGGRALPGNDPLRRGVVAVALLMALTIVVFAWSLRSGQRPPPASDPLVAAAPAGERVTAAPPPVESVGKAVVAQVSHPEVAVTLAIAPWGEVYLDGQYQGVSPPLKKLKVPAGWHEIEIRNTRFPVVQKRFEAKSGTPLRIEHRY